MPDTLAPNVTDVVELTRALVRCESVTPREAGALQHLERTLAALGFRCERMDFSQAGTDDVANLYARIGSSGRHFCFAGHSDVVPVGDLSSWTIGPFSAELSDGYLFGRGAADMKGAIAAFTEAISRFLARRGRAVCRAPGDGTSTARRRSARSAATGPCRGRRRPSARARHAAIRLGLPLLPASRRQPSASSWA